MKFIGNMLGGVLICSFISLAFFSSRSNASTFVNEPTPTPTQPSDSEAPFVSEPVSPGISPRVDSLPTGEAPRDGTIREINPRQNPNDQQNMTNDERGMDTITDRQGPNVSHSLTPTPSPEARQDDKSDEINSQAGSDEPADTNHRGNQVESIIETQAPQVSQPVTPSLSSPVDSLPTAEASPNETIQEINPRQNPNEPSESMPSRAQHKFSCGN